MGMQPVKSFGKKWTKLIDKANVELLDLYSRYTFSESILLEVKNAIDNTRTDLWKYGFRSEGERMFQLKMIEVEMLHLYAKQLQERKDGVGQSIA